MGKIRWEGAASPGDPRNRLGQVTSLFVSNLLNFVLFLARCLIEPNFLQGRSYSSIPVPCPLPALSREPRPFFLYDEERTYCYAQLLLSHV